MDSARFGRALGVGTRSAARALAAAADAAAAPNPNAVGSPSSAKATDQTANQRANQALPERETLPVVRAVIHSAARASVRATVETRQTRARIATLGRGGRRFGEAVWGPLVRLSGVLWLEMTGAFFAIFALFGAESLWRHRGDLRETALNRTAHQHLLVYALMTALFTYFTVTSFVRARRKGR